MKRTTPFSPRALALALALGLAAPAAFAAQPSTGATAPSTRASADIVDTAVACRTAQDSGRRA